MTYLYLFTSTITLCEQVVWFTFNCFYLFIYLFIYFSIIRNMKNIIFIFLMCTARITSARDICSVSITERVDCFPEEGANRKDCLSRTCCWNPIFDNKNIPWCFFSKHDVCSVSEDVRSGCYGASKRDCVSRGCCWLPDTTKGTPYCYHAKNDVCGVIENKRFDCFPEPNSNEHDCRRRGCCWRPATHEKVPYCFYGSAYFGYEVCNVKETTSGFVLDLCLRGPGGQFGKNIKKLKADFKFESNTRLHVKVTLLNQT